MSGLTRAITFPLTGPLTRRVTDVGLSAGIPVPGWVAVGAVEDFSYGTQQYYPEAPAVSRASPGLAPNGDGSWSSFTGNQLRAGSKGLIIEEERTNLVPNGAATGATISAVTPLASNVGQPTGWQMQIVNTGGGVAAYYPSSGTSQGLPYIDWRYTNSAANAADQFVNYWIPQPSNNLAMTSANNYAVSAFEGIVAGSFSGIQLSTWYIGTEYYTAAQASPTPPSKGWGWGNVFSNGNFGATRMVRQQFTPQSTSPATAYIAQRSNFNHTAVNGLPADITLRIGAIQIEQDPSGFGFETSPIITTGTSATRNADDVVPTTPPAAQTVVIAGTTAPGIGSINQVLWQLDDGTASNRLYIYRDTSRNLRCVSVVGSVEQANLNLGVVLDYTSFVVAFTWGVNAFAATLNGGSEVADVSGTVPTVDARRRGKSATGEYWNGLIYRETYFPDAKNTVDRVSLTNAWPGTTLAVETYSYLQRCSIAPGSARATLVDTLVKALKADGTWTKLDALYLAAQQDSYSARVNLINSSPANNAPVSGVPSDAYGGPNGVLTTGGLSGAVVAPAFTVDRGFTGTGSTNDALWANYNASLSSNFTQNSASIFAWNLTARAGAALSLLGTPNARIQPLDASNNINIRVNSAGNSVIANPGNSSGFYVGNRTGASAVRILRNGTLVATDTAASQAVTTALFRVLSNTSQGSSDQIGPFGWGGALTSGQETTLYSALLAYMQGVGAV